MVRFLFGLLIIGVLARPAAAAGAALPGPYAADVVRVLDGDSFEARIRIWLDQDVTVTTGDFPSGCTAFSSGGASGTGDMRL